MRQERRTPPVRKSATEDSSFAFRRSRTITGSSADTVRAASEDRGQLRSPRLHEHSLRKHRRRLSAYLALIVLGAGLLWYVVSSYIGSSLTVGTSSTQSVTSRLDRTSYEKIVHEYFNEHPFEQFTFSLSQARFSQFMSARAPEVESAELTKTSGIGVGALTVRLREPVVAWTIKDQQYFVDASGESFTRNYFAVPAVVVADKSGITADAGVVTSTKLLHFIARVITLVGSSDGSPVIAVELPPNSTREVDFKLSDHDYIIKANLDRDPAGQAADIRSAVRYIESKGINPAYVDVRVPAKAYYKDK